VSTSLGTAYIDIQPDWDSFNRRTLPQVQRQMAGITSSQTKASRTTSRLSSATAGLGGSLVRAAGAAAGAAAAYVSIAQAKEAITTTQDLAKTTAGLHRNLGIATKEASRWGAVAKARDIDTKSLTMSFTTLSRQLTDASRGSDTAVQAFKDIGVTQRDLKAANGDFTKQLLTVADGFGQAEGGALRQQAAQKLLGRGYQTLLPLFAEGSRSLQEQLHWADEYGVTLTNKTIGPINDLITAQRESKAAWLGIQVTFARAVTPALTEANKKFQSLARIMGNDRLTDAEKFQKAGKKIERWANQAKDAFLEVLPDIVERAAQAGPQIAKALVQGFMQSDAIGKLFLGGVLFARFGGSAAMTALGRKMGSKAGLAFGVAFVTLGLADPKTRAAIEEGGKRVGELFVNALIDVVNAGIRQINDRMDDLNVLGALGVDAPEIGQIGHVAFSNYQKIIDSGISDSAKRGIAAIKGLKAEIKDLDQAMDKGLKPTLKSNSKNIDQVTDNFSHLRDGLDKTGDKTKKQGDVFKDVWSETSKRSGRLAKNVSGNNASMVNTVGEGLGVLRDNVLAATKEFGVKSKITYSLKKADKAVSTVTSLLGAQKGAIVPGAGSGDTVPLHIGGQLAAMVEPGEQVSVLNRKATAAMMDINQRIPRFKGGGIVPVPGWPGEYANQAIIPALTGYLKKFNLWLSDAYGPGHASTEHTQYGTAADVGPQDGDWGKFGATALEYAVKSGWTPVYYDGSHGTTAASNHGPGNHAHVTFLTAAEYLAGKAPGGVAGSAGMLESLGRLILQGPAGRQKKIGQRALDVVRNAGNKYLNSLGPAPGDFGYIKGGGGSFVEQAARVFLGGGLNRTGTAAIIGNAYQESTWNPSSVEGAWGFHSPPVSIADVRSYADAKGQPWNSAALQANFLLKHLSPDHSSYSQSFASALNAGPLDDSVALFMNEWERPNPALANEARRLQGAKMALKMFARGGIVPHLKGGSKKPLHGAISGGSTDPAWARFMKAKKIVDRLKGILGDKGTVAKIDEKISIAETLADADGTTSPAELAKQIALNERLLEVLTRSRKLSREGLRLMHFPKGMSTAGLSKGQIQGVRGTFGSYLTDLAGVTGKGGRIFDTIVHLDELKGTSTGAAAMDISSLRSVIEAARYGAFGGLPQFHEGGTYRAPFGRNEGPALLKDGETVHKAGTTFVGVAEIDLGGGIRQRVDLEFKQRDRIARHRERQYQQ